MLDDDCLGQAAVQLGRPVESLVELDRRPLRLLTQPGSYLTLTLRDRATNEILEPTLDTRSGLVVDATELRQRDRVAVESRTALTSRLRRLILRHPDLAAIHVEVTGEGRAKHRVVTDPAGVLDLADRPGVERVDVVEEPEIRDTRSG